MSVPRRNLLQPRALVLAAALLCALPFDVNAALPDAINAIRAHGCGRAHGAGPPLHVARQLNDVARRIAAGASLHNALAASGYNAVEISSVHVATTAGAADTARMLEQRFCSDIGDPKLRDLGFAQRGADTWVVLAVPLSAPRPEDAGAVAARVLDLVNDARAHPRRCGHTAFTATTPLKLSAMLGAAALEHSRDMAERNYFDHRSPDGSTPASRLKRTGYAWKVVGENIAAGVGTPEEVVEGWLQSPEHCENLMDPRFTDMGVAYVVDARSSTGILWTQVFAVPQPDKRQPGPCWLKIKGTGNISSTEGENKNVCTKHHSLVRITVT